jgi:hypothetical protein
LKNNTIMITTTTVSVIVSTTAIIPSWNAKADLFHQICTVATDSNVIHIIVNSELVLSILKVRMCMYVSMYVFVWLI